MIEVVESGSGAEKAGLRSLEQTSAGAIHADVIKAVDGQKVTDIEALKQILSERKAGDVVRLEIERDGEKIERDVELK